MGYVYSGSWKVTGSTKEISQTCHMVNCIQNSEQIIIWQAPFSIDTPFYSLSKFHSIVKDKFSLYIVFTS
jgi:hypothetical protein